MNISYGRLCEIRNDFSPRCELCGVPFIPQDDVQFLRDDNGWMTVHLKCVIRMARAAIDVRRSARPWQSMNTAPKNATDVEVVTPDGNQVIAHYAENLSGEEQPAFRGWFTQVGTGRGAYFREIKPSRWRPLNGQAKES